MLDPPGLTILLIASLVTAMMDFLEGLFDVLVSIFKFCLGLALLVGAFYAFTYYFG